MTNTRFQQKFVSNLTPAQRLRRFSDGITWSCDIGARLKLFGGMLAACSLLAVAATADAAQWQSNDEIAAAAEKFAKDHFGRTDGRVTPVAAYLDKRVRLPLCSKPIEPFARSGTKLSSRTIVGVRCRGEKPWKVYVPVEMVVMHSVLVARKSYPGGHVLTASDVDVEKHDISRLNRGYLSDPAELSGLRLKQQVTAGRIITPSMLTAEIIVRRGQSVTLMVKNDHLNISMSGIALADGALNQRIRVENVNSQRIVEGLIRSPEIVEILVH